MRSLYRKPQKLSDHLLWKSECDRLAENFKNKALACCLRMSDRFAENLKNNAITLRMLINSPDIFKIKQPQKQGNCLLGKSKSDRLAEKFKNKA
ncbi:hypothetical protein WKK05_18230 [Nostoc sp. UHCC 0302]|uniref:hypothetical protein n=1 Tax=Nostoc sp. UHCC 0302 TaxID=3134896 RepID=UPI00311CDCE4